MSTPGPPQRILRHRVRLTALLRVDGRELRGVLMNLGIGGFCFVPVQEVELAPEAEVGLTLQLDDGLLDVPARLAWTGRSDANTLQFGCEFASLDPSATLLLERFLLTLRNTVLVLDTDPEHEEAYRSLENDFALLWAEDGDRALELLTQNEVSVIIIGAMASGGSYPEFLQTLSERFPMMHSSRLVTQEHTVAGQLQQLINAGKVFAYVRKPFSADQLRQSVRRAADAYLLSVRHEQLREDLERANERIARENVFLRRRSVGREGFEHLVGRSEPLHRVLDELERLRRTSAAAHIFGETGTGKELVARALHDGSSRRLGPFVAQNCAGLSEGLLHSTLFGHVRGAFTSADRDHSGVFQQADGGTLFLDEVAELPAAVQSSLLRVLDDGEIRPVGAKASSRVDVRVISATHRDLAEEVRRGRFREDLYYRLNVLAVRLPPLRDRIGDIPLLAMHFLDLQCEKTGRDVRGFTYNAMSALERYEWPGNVRELKNEVERLVILAEEGRKVPLELLSQHILAAPAAAAPVSPPAPSGAVRIPADLPLDQAVDLLARELLTRGLDASQGNASQAARLLQMDRTRLLKMRKRLFGPNR